MAHESGPQENSPHELLAAVRDLTRRVRVAQRGTWFPLLVFASITLVAIPIYRYAPYLDVFDTCRSRRSTRSAVHPTPRSSGAGQRRCCSFVVCPGQGHHHVGPLTMEVVQHRADSSSH